MAEFEMKCPHCGLVTEVKDEWIGMEVECPGCQKTFTVAGEAPSAPRLAVPHLTQENQASGSASGTFTFVCPSCGSEAELPNTLLGREYECKRCFEKHIAEATTERQCPFCGQTVKYHASVCKFCKADLTRTPPETVPVKEEIFIFICPECDAVTELPISMKGQQYECKCCCETSVANPAEERKCPFCGEKIKIQATLCKYCRKPVPPLRPAKSRRPASIGGSRRPSAPAAENVLLHGLGLNDGIIVSPGSSFSALNRNTLDALHGRIGTTIGTIALAQLILTASMMIPIAGVFAGFFLFPLTLGCLFLYLKIIRREDSGVGCIFAPFSDYWRSIWGLLRLMIFTTLWSLLLIVPGIIAGLRYSMTYFIMLDHPELSVKDAMEESDAITYGHKWQLFGYSLLIVVIGMLIGVLIGVLIGALIGVLIGIVCGLMGNTENSNTLVTIVVPIVASIVVQSVVYTWAGPFGASFYESIRRR